MARIIHLSCWSSPASVTRKHRTRPVSPSRSTFLKSAKTSCVRQRLFCHKLDHPHFILFNQDHLALNVMFGMTEASQGASSYVSYLIFFPLQGRILFFSCSHHPFRNSRSRISVLKPGNGFPLRKLPATRKSESSTQLASQCAD
jgi:hypothetical protein